jgi:DNA modification methylase
MVAASHEGTGTYQSFLGQKRLVAQPVGFTVDESTMNPHLFDWQRAVTAWALARGRAALFEDTGMGKTRQQLVWAAEIVKHTGGDVLIFAPLAVAEQTRSEGERIGLAVTVCRTQADVQDGINITNYEMLHHFDATAFAGIVLDEASILKSYEGVTRLALTEFANPIPYRLVATATPAPNDITEIINYAEFLDVMAGKEILALFFTQDGNTTHAWRLKKHAHADFWRWLASWAVALRKPSDLGYSDDAYHLPPLEIAQHVVAGQALPGRLFAVEAQGLSERLAARRDSIDDRVACCADLVRTGEGQWVVWCNLNREQDAIVAALGADLCVSIDGSTPMEERIRRERAWRAGAVRVLVTKPLVFGWGMNWQHCHQMAFLGLSDSYEQTYQATRRCWRFGQREAVTAHYITADTEGAVVANIERKDRDATALMDSLIREVSQHTLLQVRPHIREEMTYMEDVARGKDWTLYLGDSVLRLDELTDESVGLSLFSPPFPGMYAYTNSPHDMGNTRSQQEMLGQFRYLVGRDKLLRVTMPGRMCAIHLTQSVTFKYLDGHVGLRDFRGDVIRLMEDEGWIYYGEVTIDKDPQVKAQRTKERGLLFKTLATDSSHMRMALADYLLYFRKPGDNPVPIRAGRSEKYGNPDGWITNDEWIAWAHPVWLSASLDPEHGVRETNVLNVRAARDPDDERHLAPLQLDVCERAIKLWSAPGDLVLDPFSGIASVGCTALRFGRRFVGVELKRSYFEQGRKYLVEAEHEAGRATLWGGGSEEADT